MSATRIVTFPRDSNPYQSLLHEALREQDVQADYLAMPTRSQSLNVLLLPISLVRARLRGVRILHLHWLFTFSLPGATRWPVLRLLAQVWLRVVLWSCRLLGIQVVWTAHNVLPHDRVFWNDRAARRLLLRSVGRVILHDQRTSAELAALLRPADAFPPTTVVPHGSYDRWYADKERDQAEARDLLGLPAEPTILLFFGRVNAQKGVRELLTAWASARSAERPEAEAPLLVVAGHCNDADLTGAVLDAATSGQVLADLRYLPDADLALYLAAADAVVLPFLQATTSGSAVMAMTAGKAVVVPELSAFAGVPDDACVRYLPAAGGLDQAITEVCSLPRRRLAEMGTAGRVAAAGSTWEEAAARTAAVYRGLARRGREQAMSTSTAPAPLTRSAAASAMARRIGTDSLYRNSLMLMVNAGATTVLGGLFWVLAAQKFSAANIGILLATLSTAALLSTASSLGLPNAVVRFLPRRPESSGSLTVTAATLTGTAAGAVFAIAAATPWALPLLRHNASVVLVLLGLGTVMLAAAAMTMDATFIAQRSAHLLLIKNVSGQLIKLAAVAVLPVHSLTALAAINLLGLVTSAAITVGLMAPRLTGPMRFRLSSLSGAWSFSLGNHAGMIFGVMPMTVTPLIVLSSLGPEKAAFFGIASMLMGILSVIPANFAQSLFAELSAGSPEARRSEILRATKATYTLLVPAVLVFLAAAPLLLRVFGKGYASGGTTCLRWMVLGALVAGLNYLIDVIVNSKGAAGSYLWLNASNAAFVLGCCGLGAQYGLSAVGLGWLVAQSLSVLLGLAYLGALSVPRRRSATGTPVTPAAAVAPSQSAVPAGTPAKKSSRLHFLDGARGLAAAFVVVSHSWSTVFPHARVQRTRVEVLTAWMGFGRYAVSVFIVISGFSLGLVAWRNHLRWPGGTKAFFKGRFRRIVPAYWLAIAFGASLGATVLSHPIDTLWDGAIPIRFSGVLDHALLLQDVHWAGPAGSTAFWSLAVEWHIYLLFPLLLVLLRKRPGAWLGVFVFFAAVQAWVQLGPSTAASQWAAGMHPSLYALFVVGLVGARAVGGAESTTERVHRERMLMMAGVIGIAVTAASAASFDPISPLNDFWFGPAVALLFGRLATGSLPSVRNLLEIRPLVLLGACSYSLYLIHSAVIESVWRVAVRPAHLSGAGSLALELVLGLSASVLAAAVFYRLVEFRFLSPGAKAAAREDLQAPARHRASSPPPTRRTGQFRYVPALDGLRAVAIGCVLLGHAGVTAIVGSTQGVTVFFVVSGYLISSLLLAEHDRTGRIDLRAFYRRRFARLQPVFLLSLLVTGAYLLATGVAAHRLLAPEGASVTYATSLVFAAGSDVTGPVWGLFQHTWSLAVEEQFYLVWPTVMVLALRRRRGEAILAATAILVTVASAVDRHLLVPTTLHRMTFASDTRIDAIMLGCLLAVVLRRDALRMLAERSAAWLLPVGAALLAVLLLQGGVVNLDPSGLGAGAAASALVVGALVVRPRGVVHDLLASRMMTHLGRLSYSMYLWNVLLLTVFVRIVGSKPAQTPLGVLWLAATWAAAYASYRFVEQPLRQRFRHRRPPAIPTQAQEIVIPDYAASTEVLTPALTGDHFARD